jgi:hypothetical protein
MVQKSISVPSSLIRQKRLKKGTAPILAHRFLILGVIASCLDLPIVNKSFFTYTVWIKKIYYPETV